MTQKIALVGPESSGKSTLAAALATHFETNFVAEYARDFINKLNRPYVETDLIQIAMGQIEAEQEALPDAQKILFCDTNLLVIKIWSQVKYGRVAPEITQNLGLKSYALHLLLAPDIPWEADPQREHPASRNQLFELYHHELIQAQVPFHIIAGENRLEKAVRRCADLLMC